MVIKMETKYKRGQMKIQQMAFMLMAVTLFFILAGLFLVTIRFSGLKQSAEDLNAQNALLLASKVADSPEFTCGDAFGKTRTNCIDTDKVMALESNINKYSGFWGVDGLEILWVYPLETEECTPENYPNCGKMTVVPERQGNWTSKSNFVSLCRKELSDDNRIYDKCDVGRIIVFTNE